MYFVSLLVITTHGIVLTTVLITVSSLHHGIRNNAGLSVRAFLHLAV